MAIEKTTSLPLPPRPTSVGYSTWRGATMRYVHIDPSTLIACGLVTADQLPGERSSSRFKDFDLQRCRDGTLNARFRADYLMSRSCGFKAFVGSLLSDTRLSLVQGERNA